MSRQTISNSTITWAARSVALPAALLVCAACSSIGLRPNALPASAAVAPAAVRSAKKSEQFLYVGGLKLAMYALGASKPEYIASVNPATVFRAAIALDSHDHICESNGEISYAQYMEYDASTLTFVKGRTGIGAFPALVADSSGYLYASTGGGDIVVYAPGCTHQVNTIHRGVDVVGPLVFDHAGNLYAGMQPHYAVSVYAPTRPGHMKLVREIREGVGDPLALAIGPTNELFVASENYTTKSQSITVYQSGGSTPVRTITKGVKGPLALAVDSKGRLYVANNPVYEGSSEQGWLSVYASGGTQPTRMVKIRNPVALTLDSSDNVYIANPGNRSSVLVYNAGARKLMQTITKGIDQPSALLVGSP